MKATLKSFEEYLKSLDLISIYIEENEHSFKALVVEGSPSIEDFTQITRHVLAGYTVRLSKKDIDNNKITKGFFEDKEVNFICFGVTNLTKEQTAELKTLTKVKEMSGQARIAVYVLGDVFVGEVLSFDRIKGEIEILNYIEFIDRLKQILQWKESLKVQ